MTLKDLIKAYRKEHKLSQRQFATICGLSNGYISMLEKGENPKTKQAIIPTLPKLKMIADGMGISMDVLFAKAEDMPVNLMFDPADASVTPSRVTTTSPVVDALISTVEQMNEEGQSKVLSYAKDLLNSGNYIPKPNCVKTPPPKSKTG